MNKVIKFGNFLFRHRSVTPLPVIVLIFLLFKPGSVKSITAAIIATGLIIALLGEGIRIFAVGFSHYGTSGRENFLRADQLNQKGIYSLVRNPLYIGNFLIFNGLLVAYVNLLASLIMSVYLFLQYWFIISSEEGFLEKKYGDIYREYCRKVNRILPKFSQYEPADTGFNLKKVIFAEKDSLFNLLFMFMVILLFREYSITGGISSYFVYGIPLFILLIIYLYLNLKKPRSKNKTKP